MFIARSIAWGRFGMSSINGWLSTYFCRMDGIRRTYISLNITWKSLKNWIFPNKVISGFQMVKFRLLSFSWQTAEELLYCGQVYLHSEFLPEICWKELAEEIPFIFRFDVGPMARTLALHVTSRHQRDQNSWFKIMYFHTRSQCHLEADIIP